MTEGPSTAVVLAASSVSGVKVELTMNCQLTGSTAAGCGVTIIEAGPGFSISTAVTTALSGTDLIYAAVTITAGAQKLAAFSSTATAVAAATLTSQTASGASATGSQASSTAGASSATSASSTVSVSVRFASLELDRGLTLFADCFSWCSKLFPFRKHDAVLGVVCSCCSINFVSALNSRLKQLHNCLYALNNLIKNPCAIATILHQHASNKSRVTTDSAYFAVWPSMSLEQLFRTTCQRGKHQAACNRGATCLCHFF